VYFPLSLGATSHLPDSLCLKDVRNHSIENPFVPREDVEAAVADEARSSTM
jgi:hypothetical protein